MSGNECTGAAELVFVPSFLCSYVPLTPHAETHPMGIARSFELPCPGSVFHRPGSFCPPAGLGTLYFILPRSAIGRGRRRSGMGGAGGHRARSDGSGSPSRKRSPPFPSPALPPPPPPSAAWLSLACSALVPRPRVPRPDSSFSFLPTSPLSPPLLCPPHFSFRALSLAQTS